MTIKETFVRLSFWRTACGPIVVLTLALAPVAWAQYTTTTLYNFGRFSTDGQEPGTPMIFDGSGNLYGTTSTGGPGGGGVVYELSPSSGGSWTETIIQTFADHGGPLSPSSSLIFDGSGNLYGVSYYGGSFDQGTVYKLSPSSSGWTATVLHSFTGGSDGALARGNVVFDSKGNLFGITDQGGGSTGCPSGCGTVFELSPSGGGWTSRVLYAFTGGIDGWAPAALTVDSSGNLFGVAVVGGDRGCPSGCGTIFRLQPASGSSTSYTFGLIYSFTPLGPAGYNPFSLVLDAAGNIYGTTIAGGGRCNPGCGDVFKLTKPASAGLWKASILHAFTGTYDCGSPVALSLDSSGNVFGSTGSGSFTSYGEVFKITPVSGGWNFAVLHNFVTDGGHPSSGVLIDAHGNLFGNTLDAGQFGSGTIFEMSPR
jgi:uncharacterized repeat protein (TIGR03803 family)